VPVLTLTVTAVLLDTLAATPDGDLDSTTIEKPGVPAVMFCPTDIARMLATAPTVTALLVAIRV
jgi:hypothetical protein